MYKVEAVGVKVAIIAESFLPHINGVTNSILRTLDHLALRGHEAVVIAPAGSLANEFTGKAVPKRYRGFRVITVPSVPLPKYPEVRLSTASSQKLRRILLREQVDLVHLASPFLLGWSALRAAGELGLPTVAVYQTEVPTYAARYKFPWLADRLWEHVRAIHTAADLTLAPSSFSMAQLDRLGINNLKLLRRGVDTALFSPCRRSEAFRRAVAPSGERLIGYVGRLSADKQVGDLRALSELPGARLVVVGSGPMERELRTLMPKAHFTGLLSGSRLAEIMASLDVFVHPGESETFCQTIQEAMASRVPVVAVGRGGPLDLVDSSRTGWLYEPGQLDDLAYRVNDLVFDGGKREAFAAAAMDSVQGKTWEKIGDELLEHYRSVRLNRAAHRARF
ncbi:glycosyltransferase family 1 protein [Glutamicibacter protophormiae]|uniref:glycosyltransferase family 4 protein n=1 Tax=Glutamicibacter protophormiae TaxID=37930 RepID=UPI002A82D59D|nr:glycosyltransferase family 1 protein [Glutamicibacter protophormiae]WPR64772.1 glycosyltransferase family 1 protein [Glutamicibacter protophormiae]WPR68268.1 glycosyltransferase family 1 protein [Glutamicibacter protophormiae]